MYNLPYYQENDSKVIKAFIKKYPFAFLSGCNSHQEPVATQVPVFLEEKDGREVLRGHIMKNTDHYHAFLNNQNVLVVFTGKHSYVSGTWYKNPNTASTWNYMSVQVKGKLQFLNKNGLEDILRQTSLYFENQNQSSPTVYDNLSKAFKSRALDIIAGFEIDIKSIDTIFKLSQERDKESYFNIINKLNNADTDAQEIAREMKKRASDLFSKDE